MQVQVVLTLGQLWLARVRQAQGDPGEARELLQQTTAILEGLEQNALTGHFNAVAARVALACGDDAAPRWARTFPLPVNENVPDSEWIQRKAEYLTLSRVLMVRGEWATAERPLDRLIPLLRRTGHVGSLIEALALRAALYHAQQDSDLALTTLEQALALAEPGGYIRTFLDLGTSVAPLLRRTAFHGQDYVRQILAANVQGTVVPFVPGAQPLVETLNEREEQVLRLVAAGLSNPEIAEELFLAVNTVKWYLKSIHDKLGVHSRVEAVSRARELALL